MCTTLADAPEAVTGRVHDADMYLSTTSRRHRVARERAPGYDAGAPSLASALAKLHQARAELAAVDLETCDGDEIAGALAGLVEQESAIAVEEARLLREFDRRAAFARDACVSTMGWIRLRTELSHAAAKRRIERARLLERMPLLTEALAASDVTTEHVDVIARRAIPARLDRIAEHDEALTRLARDADPQQVKVAVKRIVEHVDPDGSDDPPACQAEDLREFRLRKGMHGLGNAQATTTPLLIRGDRQPPRLRDRRREDPRQRGPRPVHHSGSGRAWPESSRCWEPRVS